MKNHAPALQEYFKDNKDVVFVNLCVLSETDSWINRINTLNIGGENYLFDKEASDKFMGLYDLSGVPFYLLMDKKGNLVTNRAPRPSDRDEAIKQIEAQQ